MATVIQPEHTSDYHVFLSFRGSDTRRNFTDCLYNIMTDSGIRVFRDDDELSAGKPIDTILMAIDNSKICMPVFSPNFASSVWCLREVAKMVELGKEVIPVFLGVTPEDVKLRTTVYRDHMGKHEIKYGKDQVSQWEDALLKVARIKGPQLNDKGYYEFSKELTRDVLIMLKPNKKYVPSHLTGMDNLVESVLKLIDAEAYGVRCIGIHGMGGIGKTTLAKVILNKLAMFFDSCCFLEDVRESLKHNGIEHLQKDLLCKLDPKLKDITHIIDPLKMILQSFRKKKVLIVLDDVDKKEYIDRLVGETNRFASASRIIVTTRDDRVLRFGHEPFQEIFEVKVLNFGDSLQLFCHHAFGRDSPSQGFKSLSAQVVECCKGLPLALEVMGSFLCLKSETIWMDTVKKLEKVTDQEVQGKLRISYDALEHEQQQIFIDIACFFINAERTYVSYMWDACDFHPIVGLDALVSMSLVKIVEDDKLWMHDLLRDIGREIVRKERLQHGRQCSRLWEHRGEEMIDILKIKEGKEDIVGLRLEGHYPKSTGDVLAGMHNLRYLTLEEPAFSREFKHPLPVLKWLSWPKCPSNLNTSYLNIRKLVILELPHSSISEKWKGWSHLQMEHLKVLDLTKCSKLKCTPDFSRMPELERLTLSGCINLSKLHDSIIELKKLKHLDLTDCSSLRSLPKGLGSLENLEHISLHGCTRLEEIRGSNFGTLNSLVELDLSGKPQSMEDIFDDFHLLHSGSTILTDEHMDVSLQSGFFDHTIKRRKQFLGEILADGDTPLGQRLCLKELPVTFGNLKALTKLNISYSSVNCLPESFGDLENLKELHAQQTSLTSLPKSIGMLKKLEVLNLGRCYMLEIIPAEIGGLRSLTTLNLSHALIGELPVTIAQLSRLQSLNLFGCGAVVYKKNPVLLIFKIEYEIISSNQHENAPPLLRCGFGDFSQLERLEVHCRSSKLIPMLPSSLQHLVLQSYHSGVKLPDLSNSSLVYLCISFSGEDSEYKNAVQFPESLRELRVFYPTSLPDLSNLKNLRKLVVVPGLSLKQITGLGKMELLESLEIYCGKCLESLENISGLRNLKRLSIFRCQNSRLSKDLRGCPWFRKMCTPGTAYVPSVLL